MATITLTVNNEAHVLELSPETPLLWVLRDTLGLTGTKFGCGIGLCGACTIFMSGEARRACVTPVSAASEPITTIEGLSSDGSHPLQRAWIAEQVPQCGYCMPGQIMTAAALLTRTPHPHNDEINAAMSNVLCRCGTYQRIRRAIQRAVEEGI